MAQFVDISTLTDVSASFPNEAWIQTSATQKANVNKVYNNAGFISGLKLKLNLSGLSLGFDGSKLSFSDTYLTAFNKLGSNLYEVEEILSAPDSNGDYHPGSTSKQANTLCLINYYTSSAGNDCNLNLDLWMERLKYAGGLSEMTIMVSSACRFSLHLVYHNGPLFLGPGILDIIQEVQGYYYRVFCLKGFIKAGGISGCIVNGALYMEESQ